MNKTEYETELKDIGEMLAFVGFTGCGYEILNQRGVTHDDIKHFVVTMFFASFINDENTTEVELDVRFTVYVNVKGSNTDHEITFMFNDQNILDAIIDKKHDIEFGYAQKHEWRFPKPNPIQLFDARFTLDEKVGIV